MPRPDRQAQLQARIDALPPVDTSRFHCTVERFVHYPDDQVPTAWIISVNFTDSVTGQSQLWSTTVALSVADDIAATNNVQPSALTQSMVLDYVWANNQFVFRSMQRDFLAGVAAIQARGGQPVPLPAGDLTGKPFVPQPS